MTQKPVWMSHIPKGGGSAGPPGDWAHQKTSRFPKFWKSEGAEVNGGVAFVSSARSGRNRVKNEGRNKEGKIPTFLWF